MAEPTHPSLRRRRVLDFPFLGVCSRCKRIAWSKKSTASSDKWPHDCDLFASPYTHARVWDTVESIDASRFNLFHLLIEANDYLQVKFGGSPHLVRELPEPPRLYWPLEIPADLNLYIYGYSKWTSHQTTLAQGTPFISLCPACCRVVWFSGRGDLCYHWLPSKHSGWEFSTTRFSDLESPDANDETERSLEKYNSWFQTLFNVDPSRLRLFHDPPPHCRIRNMLLRLPCGQFTDLAPEIWIRREDEKADHSVEWQQRATDQHVRLRSKFGASRHPIETGPDSQKLSGQPIWEPTPDFWNNPSLKWPLIEDPDVVKIIDFRDRLQNFFRRNLALLEGEQTHPFWAPHSAYRAFPESGSTDCLQITALLATAEIGTVEADAAAEKHPSEASAGTNVLV